MRVINVDLDYFKGRDTSNDLNYDTFFDSEIVDILEAGKIPASSKTKLFDPFTEKKRHFIKFQNNEEPKLSVILDRKKLSERYDITSYNKDLEKLRCNGIDVQRIIAYSNDIYEIDRIGIDRETYEMIRGEFLSLSDEEKRTKNVIASKKGKSPKRGLELKEQISCCKRDCTVHISPDKLTSRQLLAIAISKTSEPWVWLDDDEEFIDVSECIVGIYSYRWMYDLGDEGERKIIEWLRPLCEKYGKDLHHETVAYYPFIYDYFVMC